MDYTKCTRGYSAIEYNEKYLDNIKLACYCPYCCMTTKRESTPYKIIQTDNGYIEIRDDSHVSDDEEEGCFTPNNKSARVNYMNGMK